MKRLTIFAKGNLDLRDSLHSLRLGGEVKWNGINEVLRAAHPGVLARIRHETWTRSDALLAADGAIPAAFEGRDLPLGAHPLEAQFRPAVFEQDADVVVLSIQPDVCVSLLRHKRDGFLFFPSHWEAWAQADRDWLRTEFVREPPLDVEQSMANFEQILARLRERSQAPVLIYNLSAVTPGERVHDHQGMDELFSTQARRFNLGLIELSRRTGASIVDVDSVVARGGADRLKYDTLHLTGDGCRAVAEAVAEVLEDHGLLATGEAAA